MKHHLLRRTRIISLAMLTTLALLALWPLAAKAATTTISDQASCEAAGGTWIEVCILESAYTVASGDTLTYSGSARLFINDYLTVQSGGTVNINGKEMRFYSTLTNSGTINLNTGLLSLGKPATNVTGGLIIVKSSFEINNTLTNDGTIRVLCGGSIAIILGSITGNPPQYDDCSAPTASPTQTPAANANGWNNSDVTVNWNWSDNDGGSGIDPDNCTTSSVSNGEGSNLTLTATCKDKVGNLGTATYTVKVDKTKPVVAVTLTKADGSAYTPGTWSNQAVTVKFNCSDDLSGFTEGNSLVCLNTEVSGSGTAEYGIGITDLAGNSASARSGVIKVDQTPPAIVATATTADGQPYTSGAWTNQKVTLVVTCTDSLSGLATCPDAGTYTFDTEGTTSKTFSATDNVGNSGSRTFNVNIDRTAPTVTATPSRAPDANGWYNAPVTYTFSGVDNAGGSGGVTCDTAKTYSGPDSATASVTGSCKDAAGNSSSATASFKYDATPPTITASAKKADGTAYAAGTWTNQTVTVSFSCNDATSGVAGCPAVQTFSSEGGSQSASGSVTDNAGNSASASFGPIKIDKTAPTVTATPSRAPGANGWYNAPVTYTFSGDDGSGSGIAGCDTAKTYSGPDSGSAQVTGSCKDAAGNTGSATANLKYDATAPTVTYSGNAGSYTIDQAVNITCTPADNLSGVASSTCANIIGPAYSFALGNNTRSATATDKAGNTGGSSASFTVSVTFDSLCTLSASFSTDPAVDKGLCDKLAAAKAATDSKTRSNILDAYRQQVAAQTGKALSKDQAATLTRLSKAL